MTKEEEQILLRRIADLEFRLNRFEHTGLFYLDRDVYINKGRGITIGTATTQKLAFFGATPVVQQSASGATLGMTTPGGATVQEANTFIGSSGSSRYTIHGIVEALKQVGILAM